MFASCHLVAFGIIDYAFPGLLIKTNLGTVRIDCERTTVRVKEEFSLRYVIVSAASVMLDGGIPYLSGKFVVLSVGQCIPYHTLTDWFAINTE